MTRLPRQPGPLERGLVALGVVVAAAAAIAIVRYLLRGA